MKPSPLVAYSTLPLNTGEILPGCNGRIKYNKEAQADPEEREGSVIPEDNHSRV